MHKIFFLLAFPLLASGQVGVNATDLECEGDGMVDNSMDNSCMSNVAASNISVYFPKGTYNFSSPITIAHPIIISGEGNVLSVLNYTGTGTTAAITWNPSTGSFAYGMGLRDIGLAGTSANGLLVGGSNQPAGFECFACRISGFTTAGVSFGDNTWNTLFDHCQFWDTYVLFPSGLSNSGEEMIFSHSTFAAGTGYTTSCVSLSGTGNLVFSDDSFDNCQVVVGSSTLQVSLRDDHFEDASGAASAPYIIQSAGIVELFNPNMAMSSVSGTDCAITLSGGQLNIIDGSLNVGTGSSLPEMVSATNGTLNLNGTTYLGNVGAIFLKPPFSTANVYNNSYHSLQ